MFLLSGPFTSIGLESATNGLKAAAVQQQRKRPVVTHLFNLDPLSKDVKLLYMQHPFLVTGLEGHEVLVRPLQLPLVKTKDIQEALNFQAEPLLPYPIDQALLSYQIVEKQKDQTQLTLLAVRKDSMQTHLDYWQTLKIEPESVSCVASALAQFGTTYLEMHQTYLILHLSQKACTCILIKDKKLAASFSYAEGAQTLLNVQEQEELKTKLQSLEEWQALSKILSPVGLALTSLQKQVTRLGFALSKEVRGVELEGILITGEGSDWTGFNQFLTHTLPWPLLSLSVPAPHSAQEWLAYAVPIGLALEGLSSSSSSQPPIDFRQQEWSYPHPWSRLKIPLLTSLAGLLLLSVLFYFFSQFYLQYQEKQLKQAYVNLLTEMGKPYEQFEETFLVKNPQAKEKRTEEIVSVTQLNLKDIEERLAFLQKDLQAIPDSFPLFANIPRVSDVLAWLSQHPTLAYQDEKGEKQARLQIENFAYTMVKRPVQGKKQEKYQVKVELELSSSTPKWAREFHDALIAPNEWVDPKAEVKWNSNRGRYTTSFYLKDKTVYISQ